MKQEIKEMKFDELLALQHEIRQELQLRQRDERRALLSEFNEKAKALGLTAEELVRSECGKVKVSMVVAKYTHPKDHSLAWSGEGMQPQWVSDWLESGKTLEQLHALALLENHFAH